jgi:hypothetical protein
MLRRAVLALGLMSLPALAVLGASLSAVLGPAGGARANGVPQLVKLTYLDGVSNYGPRDAQGVLEFSFAEAYARVDVKSLPPAQGVTYEGWLIGGAGQPLLVGTIVPGSDGVGVLETKLAGLSRYDYNTFVIAARTAESAAGKLPSKISIAGRFTIIQDITGTPISGDIQAGARPSELPDTGQAAGASTRERLGWTFMVVAVTGGAAIVGLSFLRRRKRHD